MRRLRRWKGRTTMDNEITVQEELESAAAEIPADAVEEPET